jgi:hypothetical protein
VIAFDYFGGAALLGALGVFITALATAYVTIRAARLGRTTHEMVRQIDHAVNGKPPGSTTMVQQVQGLTDKAFPPDEDAILPLLRRIAAGVERTEQQNGTSP